MIRVNWPTACAGCGNTNADELKHYKKKEKGSHSEKYGTVKETKTYYLETNAFLCKDCKKIARSQLFKGWLKGLPFSILILIIFVFYPIFTQHWWLFEIFGWQHFWIPVIVYVILLYMIYLQILGGLGEILFSPYKHFLDVRIDASRFGAQAEFILRNKEYAALFKQINPGETVTML